MKLDKLLKTVSKLLFNTWKNSFGRRIFLVGIFGLLIIVSIKGVAKLKEPSKNYSIRLTSILDSGSKFKTSPISFKNIDHNFQSTTILFPSL